MNTHINRLFVQSICFMSLLSALSKSQGIQYIFPEPGDDWIPQKMPIIVRFDTIRPDVLSNIKSFITLWGSKSGPIQGNTVISSDSSTLNFKPDVSYHAGEEITVHLTPCMSGQNTPFLDITYRFFVAPEIEETGSEDSPGHPPLLEKHTPLKTYTPNEDGVVVLNGVSVPSDFPYIDIFVNNNPAPGYIFCHNIWGVPMYNLILDHMGAPIWYDRNNEDRRDMKVQNGIITMKTRGGFNGAGHIGMDNTYTVKKYYYAPEGYSTDEHELQVLPDGSYLIIGLYYRTHVDVSKIVQDANKNATVSCQDLIKMDSNNNPVFIWRAWNYLDIKYSYYNLTQPNIDYQHMNSIAVDLDGHYVISCRELKEITKIDKNNGSIIWRMGGENDQFTWVNDNDRIAYQHDCRVLPNGNYTVFDNGDNGNAPDARYSRALEIKVNTQNMTVTKVWEFRDNSDKYSWFMGNVQRLPNGNTLINWGVANLPKVTEVHPDGTKVFEMNFTKPAHCYRAFKFDWEGKARIPTLFLEAGIDRLTLIFNKFGDPDVKSYLIYGRTSTGPINLMAETSNPYYVFDGNDLENRQTYFFSVKAVDSQGNTSDYSNEESVTTHFVPTDVNIIYNGDFSSGLNDWTFEVQGSASAQALVVDGACRFDIQQGGERVDDIQLRQGSFELRQGETYRFEFDAWAESARTIQVKVEEAHGAFIDYSRVSPIPLRSSKKHFAYTFRMDYATDYHSQIVFEAGTDANDVYIDNISLLRVDPSSSISNPGQVQALDFCLNAIYPNPFNSTAIISFTLPVRSLITLELVDMLGRTVQRITSETLPTGHYERYFDGSRLSSGLYLCRMNGEDVESHTRFHQNQKMMILK